MEVSVAHWIIQTLHFQTKADIPQQQATMKLRPLLAACLALIVIGTTAHAGKGRFELFLVKTPHTELEKIELEAKPLLTDGDVTSYDWQTHSMVLTKDAKARLPKAREIGVRGLGFVIVVDGKRLYRGSFWTSFSSIGCPTPVILLDQDDAGYVLRIRRAYPSDEFAAGPDPRGDERLLQVLRELGKLARPPAGSR
jgi:hypothetical protein